MKTDKIAVAMHQQQSQVNHTSKTPRRVSDKGGSWEEHIDPGTNKIYYHNKITSVSQWDKPQGYNFQNAINPIHTVTSIPRRVSNSDQWEEHLDKNSGKIYYHNKRTNITQWEKPANSNFVSTNNIVNSPRTPRKTFEMEQANPMKQNRQNRQSRNSWSNLNNNDMHGRKIDKVKVTEKKFFYAKMIGICCCIFVICGVILSILLVTAGKRGGKGGVRPSSGGDHPITTTLPPSNSVTTAIPTQPLPVSNPTRLVGQELKINGLSLQQVNDNLNAIKIGIAKSLNVANDDVIIVSVSVGNRRRRERRQRARRRGRMLLQQKVNLFYKVKVLNDNAVTKIMEKMKSNSVKANIVVEMVKAIPNVSKDDISFSSTAPSSEVYNSVTATTPPPKENFNWRECGNETVPKNQPSGWPKDVLPGISTLPQSTANMILSLKRISAIDCSSVPVARSYDGNVWEGTYPEPHDPSECDTNTKECKIETSNTNVAYRIDAYVQLNDELRTKNETISRFLLQATYGASRNDIGDFIQSHGMEVTSSTVSSYLDKQMNIISPTLLREHFRKRTNPRTPVNSAAGVKRHICESGSRFHRFSFNQLDLQKTLNISTLNENTGTYELAIDGILRTEVASLTSISGGTILAGNNYVICKVEEWTGTGRVVFYNSDNKCAGNDLNIVNPLVNFTNPNLDVTQVFGTNDVDIYDLQLPDQDAILITKYKSTCNEKQLHGVGFIKLSGRGSDKTFYKHDPRLKLLDNSFEKPVNVSAFEDTAMMCPSVPKTFLNRDKCVRLAKACSPLQFTSGLLPLNSSNLRLWYTANQRHVHYLTGLRLESPYDTKVCEINGYTRWKKINNGPCSGGITPILVGTTTNDTIVNALVASTDSNPFIRDINVYWKNNAGCDKTLNIDVGGVGAKVEASNICWQHVHEHEYNVYDFTYWTIQHDGNKIAKQFGRPNPITKFAIDGRVDFVFPGHHEMLRWKQKVNKFIPYVGRYGDSVNFESLNTEVQTYELAKIANAVSSDGSDGYESCGSPGEIKNEPHYGHLYRFPSARLNLGIDFNNEIDFPHYRNEGKHMVWLNVVLKSPDQLRQKVAWALSQILVISESGLNGKDDEVENWITYYDNFVRNAFGSYRTVLKEVTYSPMMGQYLTYMQNKAFKFAGTFPDENYAREIMQLFTIGLWKLNIDGTYKLDSNGEKQATYTNDDIVAFARIWTGFDRSLRRSNLEQQNGIGSGNFFDPMQIKAEWRDFFPKRALDKGFIGDGYPLCADLPSKNEFLMPGATYVNTGAHSDEGEWYDRDAASDRGVREQFTPSNTGSSQLFNTLCSRISSTEPCQFPDIIKVTNPIQCNGDECDIDFIRVVKLVDLVSNKVNYYTYQRQPCVRLTFFNEGKVTVDVKSLQESVNTPSRINRVYQCANPHAKAAGATCCNSDGTVQELPYKRSDNPTACNFALEFMSYNTTKNRCKALGWQVCDTVKKLTWTPAFKKTCGVYQHSWTTSTCKYEIQVRPSGYINILDIPRYRSEYALNNDNLMLLWWKNNAFPTVQQNSCGSGCTVSGTSCRCNITVVESIGFSSTTNGALPTVAEIEDTLHIGAYSPSQFYNIIDSGTYTLCTTTKCNDHYTNTKVQIYLHSGSGQSFDTMTIFKLPAKLPGGKLRYLMNKVSTVHVGENFQFRNPPNFMPSLGETYTYRGSGFSSRFHVIEATQEVDALLDHVFEHPNTAPFISHRLIQRLVTSNPSPRYVKAVSTAFINGKTSDGHVYSGKYGDIGAAVAEILLDQEARSTTLDSDALAGRLREPLLKVIHVMKAMEYKSKDAREVNLYDMDRKVGQASFASPTVFNFFLPEFTPPGPIYNANLVSPESQLSTTPLLIGFLNGMESLISNGLTNCNSGFGDFTAKPKRACGSTSLKLNTNDGSMQYIPSVEALQKGSIGVIGEIDVLLTTGRLNENDRNALIKTYDETLTSGGQTQDAVHAALRLLVMTSEFHTTTINRITKSLRPIPPEQTSQNRPYKAIIVLFLAGAADSFNMLVPHSECANSHDLHQEYLDVRTNVALSKSSLLEIDVPANSQPCNKFGIHPSLSVLKTEYDAGNANFIANMGALVEPLTKAEYNAKSKRVPPSLFAHNVMQRAMHTVHAQYASSNGVLGRVVKAISKEQKDTSNNVVPPYSSYMYSLSGNQRMLEGAAPSHVPFIIDKRHGVVRYSKYSTMKTKIENISRSESESIFAETFSANLETSLRQTENLGALLKDVTLTTTFSDEDQVSQQLNQVSKLIKLRQQLNSERDVFIITHGGYDTHNDVGDVFKGKLDQINAGLDSFVKEMKDQNIYENVVLVTTSDFGRTLTSNGQGTDHAWGGNYFTLGGSVKGSKILGQYPEKLGDDGLLNIGRGRVLPTTSWEAMWNGLAEWFGIVPDEMDKVLPNKKNFPADHLFTKDDLFK